MHASRQIKYSNSKIRATNSYKPLKLVLGTMPAYPYTHGYS